MEPRLARITSVAAWNVAWCGPRAAARENSQPRRGNDSAHYAALLMLLNHVATRYPPAFVHVHGHLERWVRVLRAGTARGVRLLLLENGWLPAGSLGGLT